ncbi:hypothetical protein [uncultured Novosphingobium sp.]|uniref:hypothetical protein n=1 Tax=uncultured Novosphingobium sp. TaxID=292277 RepID=UPI003749D4A4
MPRISQITDDFAERFNFEPSRVAQIAKALRMDADGLIRSGPRGVNAPDATPLEAARLLIAMMLRVKHHEAAEGVKLFGRFRPLDGTPVSIGGKAAQTFEDAFAILLGYCGQPTTPGEFNPLLDRFEFSLWIHRDTCFADIFIGQWEGDADEDAEAVFARQETFRFVHPEFGAVAANDYEMTPELRASWRRYRTGFHETPMLTKNDLIEIGQVLAGHMPPLLVAE